MAQNNSTWLTPEFKTAFNYADKSSTLRLEDWLSLLTLCFAPLLGHIVAGVPTVIRLSRKPPSWLDIMCLYNPTTILWRYLAIVDRRVRSETWSPADMAASNAYFWTDGGFDGSEDMMWRSRAFCTRMPPHNRTMLFSTDSLKTLITTLQGVQALTVMVRGLLAMNGIGNKPFLMSIAMDSIFYPLAVFGLLRLFAAPWLTEEYSFAEHHTGDELALSPPSYPRSATEYECELSPRPAPPAVSPAASLTESPMIEWSADSFYPKMMPRAARNGRSIALRAIYLGILWCFLIICICHIIPFSGNGGDILAGGYTATLWLLGVTFIFFSTTSIVTFTVYLIQRGKSTATMIPCIGHWWYRAYTFLLLGAAIALIAVSGINTRRTPCGRYTILPNIFDSTLCNGTPVHAGIANGILGFAGRRQLASSDSGATPANELLVVVPLEGWCSGTLAGDSAQVAMVQ